MSHNATTHRRSYTPPTAEIPPTTATTTTPTTGHHHPDPSITTISNHFSNLYFNHKARSSAQPPPADTSTAACLTKSHSQRTKLSHNRPRPHYYYFNKPVMDEEDNIKRAIVVSNIIPADKQPDVVSLKSKDGEEKRGADEMKKLPKGYDVEKQSLSSVGMIRGRRRSFGSSSQAELADFFACNGVKLVSADMPPYMQIHVVDVTRKTYDSLEKFTAKTLALTLKKEFDGVYGPAWHCIVGSSFGSFVTHSVGGFMYFSMDHKIYVLLFKTAVQRAH